MAEKRTSSTRRRRPRSALRATLARIELLVLDVDGVLTDGSIVYGPRGAIAEQQAFHVHDGIALGWLAEHGVRVAWISGRGCAATRARAKELGVRELHLRVRDKAECLAGIQRRLRIARAHTACMGDDLPDLALLSRSALFAAPANAVPEVLARADLVTAARGGGGAVRELACALLAARGAWERIVSRSLR